MRCVHSTLFYFVNRPSPHLIPPTSAVFSPPSALGMRQLCIIYNVSNTLIACYLTLIVLHCVASPGRVVQPSKWRSFRTRAASAVVMIGGFCMFLALGHVPMVCMIFLIQGLMVRELFALAVEVRKEKAGRGGAPYYTSPPLSRSCSSTQGVVVVHLLCKTTQGISPSISYSEGARVELHMRKWWKLV